MNLFPFRQDRSGKEEAVEDNIVEGERDAAALATHQAVSDAYRANYKIQVERHAERYGTAGAA